MLKSHSGSRYTLCTCIHNSTAFFIIVARQVIVSTCVADSVKMHILTLLYLFLDCCYDSVLLICWLHVFSFVFFFSVLLLSYCEVSLLVWGALSRCAESLPVYFSVRK